MTIEERAEKAVELKKGRRYNCAQAVAAVLADQTELTEEQLYAVTAAFCVGMGTQEATCGALTGAGIVAGLRTGGKSTLKYAKQILEDFKQRSGAVNCRELKSVTDGKPLCSCEDCVRNAVLAYGEVLGV